MIMNCFKIKISTASVEELEKHLKACAADFKPPLDSCVNISTYARKISDNAMTVEYWCDNVLAGLVAVYYNDPLQRTGYITNVSLLKGYRGKGIALAILSKAIEYGDVHGFRQLKLEVRTGNSRAIKLYHKFGFSETSRHDDTIEMIKTFPRPQ
jgi:ribosomal-protein-alanine N-acetyltransferase